MTQTARFGGFVSRADGRDLAALTALRELVLLADERGTLPTYRLPASAREGIERLRAQGIVDAAVATEDAASEPADGPSGAGGGEVRFTPAALADLQELEIEQGREHLVRSIDGRIAELTAAGSPASATTDGLTAPQPAADSLEQTPSESAQPDADGADASEADAAATAPDSQDAQVAQPAGSSTLGSRGLVKIYKKRRVVNEVDLHLRQGEIVGLLGPNGAGKTTTFYMVVGLIKPDRGKVFLGDDDVTDVPMYRRARRGIGYLAQEPSVFRKLTVEENVLAVLQMLGLPRREQRERLERLLDELGIKHLRHTKAYALSGGERRRLEITRALVGNPKFMLLDEPFAGVDPIAVHDIQQIVADLRRREIGVLISDHNVEQTLDIVDRAYIMYDGRVRVAGTVSELVWNDEVAEIYLGPTLTARMRQRYVPPSERAG